MFDEFFFKQFFETLEDNLFSNWSASDQIFSRCVSPDDSTVRIYKNGISYDARFKFDMFRWKQRLTEWVEQTFKWLLKWFPT